MANEFARELRKNPTIAEARLWRLLRRKRLLNYRFRRQQPIGPYVADFFCAPERLIVELDGSQHYAEDNRRHDRIRTAWLARQGYRVIRFGNADVLKVPDGVVEAIWRALTAPPSASFTLRANEAASPSRGEAE
jgi:very-short-patch-repair endonuclease